MSVKNIRLRKWQVEALSKVLESDSTNFTVVACPGAGKTTFALVAALHLLAIERRPLLIVTPTEHLKTQWANAAAKMGLVLDPQWSASSASISKEIHGAICTYAQASSQSTRINKAFKNSVALIDEGHHAAETLNWGEGLVESLSSASRRIILSGTPFRSDDNMIPFIEYKNRVGQVDYGFSYKDALATGGIVRPVRFVTFGGEAEWSKKGIRDSASLDERNISSDKESARQRALLSPSGEWITKVLSDANDRLESIRGGIHTNAGGLVLCRNQAHANGIARQMRSLGLDPEVVTSSTLNASEQIEMFGKSKKPWIVAVRMISEGVDIPRLRVLVYASSITTELFFVQALGRVIRWQSSLGDDPQTAWCFMPADHRLLQHLNAYQDIRQHIISTKDEEEDEIIEGFDDFSDYEPKERKDSVFDFVEIGSMAGEKHEHQDQPAEISTEHNLVETEIPAPPFISSSEETIAVLNDSKALKASTSAAISSIARRTGKSVAEISSEVNRRCGVTRSSHATPSQIKQREHVARTWLRSLGKQASKQVPQSKPNYSTKKSVTKAKPVSDRSDKLAALEKIKQRLKIA